MYNLAISSKNVANFAFICYNIKKLGGHKDVYTFGQPIE